MPTKNNNTTNILTKETLSDKKTYNPSITGFVPDDRFGLEADGKKLAGTAFRSYQINEEGYANIQRHIQLGTTLVLRKSTKLNKKNQEQWFLEILPPMENKLPTNRVAKNTAEDSI